MERESAGRYKGKRSKNLYVKHGEASESQGGGPHSTINEARSCGENGNHSSRRPCNVFLKKKKGESAARK